MANQPTPYNPPAEIAGLMIRAYENPLVSLNKAGEKKTLFRFGGYVHGNLRGPRNANPPRNKAKLRDYEAHHCP